MSDDHPKCAICGADAVAVDDLDTDHAEWRCAAHVEGHMKDILSLASLFSGDEVLSCIVPLCCRPGVTDRAAQPRTPSGVG
jgi:hypothetical protein